MINITTVEGLIAGVGLPLFLLIVFGITLLKGMALWKSCKRNEKKWFWILLFTSTLGILPAIYLYLRRRK